MHASSRRVLVVALIALLGGCTRSEAPPQEPSRREVRVLFVGNSYTYFNNLPALLAAFVDELEPDTRLVTEAVLEGGASLESHWSRGEAPRRIAEGRWDFVVLQEQSTLGGSVVDGVAQLAPPEQKFLPYARRFADAAKTAGARPVFWMTWSRRKNLEAQAVLAGAYDAAARDNRAILAPVGLAWQQVRRERPELELYIADGHHPGPAGSYLAACVLYATLFERPCLGVPRSVEGPEWTGSGFDSSRVRELVALSRRDAGYLQRIGSQVALAHSRSAQPAASRARKSR